MRPAYWVGETSLGNTMVRCLSFIPFFVWHSSALYLFLAKSPEYRFLFQAMSEFTLKRSIRQQRWHSTWPDWSKRPSPAASRVTTDIQKFSARVERFWPFSWFKTQIWVPQNVLLTLSFSTGFPRMSRKQHCNFGWRCDAWPWPAELIELEMEKNSDHTSAQQREISGMRSWNRTGKLLSSSVVEIPGQGAVAPYQARHCATPLYLPDPNWIRTKNWIVGYHVSSRCVTLEKRKRRHRSWFCT